MSVVCVLELLAVVLVASTEGSAVGFAAACSAWSLSTHKCVEVVRWDKPDYASTCMALTSDWSTVAYDTLEYVR